MTQTAKFQSWAEVYDHLQVADIILMRYRRGIIPRAIRKASASYWNHVALVLETAVDPSGRRRVLIVEALPEGIRSNPLEKYADDPARFEIGVKRLPGLTETERARIHTFFLGTFGLKYNFTLLFAFLLRSTIARLFGIQAIDFIKKNVINTDQFVCSSLTQRAFYLALPPDQRERAFFLDDRDLSFLDRTVAITPGDIARSMNTEWLYNPHD